VLHQWFQAAQKQHPSGAKAAPFIRFLGHDSSRAPSRRVLMQLVLEISTKKKIREKEDVWHFVAIAETNWRAMSASA
jgi:hypothetical protein